MSAKKIFLYLSLLFLIACAGSKSASKTIVPPVPTQADADRGAMKIPGLTLAQLNTGKTNFEQQCSKCHKLKDPASRDETEWRKVVPKMAAKAEKKMEKVVIDQAMQESILAYLITMGKQ